MRALYLLAIALLLLPLPHLVTGQTMADPPFVRKWTALAGEFVVISGVREGVLFYHSRKGAGALSLATGQPQWASLADKNVTAAALQGQRLYALTQSDSTTTLHVIEAALGKARVLATLPVEADLLRTDSKRIYILDRAARLWAYPLNSGTALWSRPLNPSKSSLVGHLPRVTAQGLRSGMRGCPEKTSWRADNTF